MLPHSVILSLFAALDGDGPGEFKEAEGTGMGEGDTKGAKVGDTDGLGMVPAACAPTHAPYRLR